jgi:hypothetical protein
MIKLNKLRQGSEGLAITKILAYNTKELVTTIKRFVKQVMTEGQTLLTLM